nr:uncharacterized protein LOC127303832 [Lolium perenne]
MVSEAGGWGGRALWRAGCGTEGAGRSCGGPGEMRGGGSPCCARASGGVAGAVGGGLAACVGPGSGPAAGRRVRACGLGGVGVRPERVDAWWGPTADQGEVGGRPAAGREGDGRAERVQRQLGARRPAAVRCEVARRRGRGGLGVGAGSGGGMGQAEKSTGGRPRA